MFFLAALAAAPQIVLTVYAAASLHAAFPELGQRFESTHPGVTLRFSFNGSQALEAQLTQGAHADIFASADQSWMDKATSDGLVDASTTFATNSLVVIASTTSPVQAARDLSIPGLRLVLCADAVPCGRYARAILKKMDSDPQFAKGFAASVARNIASEEENVESVVAKVNLGEADAGIVYRSDVVKLPAHARVVGLPAIDQPAIVYPIAVVKGSAFPSVAADFIAFVRSTEGQDILRHNGFTPAPYIW
jgi:molybdate transport system substrate-binding protein